MGGVSICLPAMSRFGSLRSISNIKRLEFAKLYLALGGCLVTTTVRADFKSVKHKCRHSLGKLTDLGNVGSLVLFHMSLYLA